MSRNGSGTYSLPSGNPVVTGTVISSTWANTTLNDIASALTTSIASDGQTPITANLPMSGYKLTGLGTGANPGDSVRYEQLFPSLSTETVAVGAGGLTVSGNAVFSGGATLGDAAGDALRIVSTLASLGSSLTVSGGANQGLLYFSDGTARSAIGFDGSNKPYFGSTTANDVLIRRNGVDKISVGSNETVISNSVITFSANAQLNTASGTFQSTSIYNSTTAAAADVSISGTTGYLQRSTSSRRWKTGIETVTPERSEFIYKMRPVWYRSTCETDRKDWSYYGFLAEEVADLEPRIVHWEDDPDNDGKKRPSGLMYDRITVFLVMEIQKLRSRIQALEGK